MQTSKPNVILSILVLIVSFLSILVINKQVMAAWYYPQANPPDTVLDNHLVFNPTTESLSIGSDPVTSVYYNLCLGGYCRNTWPAEGGGGGSDANWSINANSSNDLYYSTSSPASGRVGIGTSTPNSLLHVYKSSGANNAEIDIQSVAGTNNHWGIYQDRGTKDLRFWQGNDRVTFAAAGEVGIGAAPIPTIPLYVNTAAGSVSIFANNTYAGIGGTGLMGLGTGTGVLGSAPIYGVQGISSSVTTTTGAGVFGQNSAGGYAAKFDGPVYLGGNTTVATNKYLQISYSKNAPSAGACTASDTGRLYFAWGTPTLYICNQGSWLGLTP